MVVTELLTSGGTPGGDREAAGGDGVGWCSPAQFPASGL